MLTNMNALLPLLLAAATAPFTLAAPAPAPAQLDARTSPSEILPTTIINHDMSFSSPNVCLHPSASEVSIYKTSSGGGRSVMYSFTYPSIPAGAQCWLELTTTGSTNIVPSTGAQVDVFTQWAAGKCDGVATGNNRNVYLGRLNVPKAGTASWKMTGSSYLTGKIPCPKAGTVENLEVVVAGDSGEASFSQGAGAGLRIMYSS